MPSDIALFLRQLIRNPVQTSAILPSSGFLARAMVAGLGPNSGRVVEFGPGTGVFTRAILKAGVRPQDLVLFEMNPDFASHLRRQFPDVTVHVAGAQDAPKHCPAGVGTVISGLPLLSMPTDVRRAIVGGAFNVLRKGGTMVQFTYGPNPPLDDESFTALGLTHQRGAKIWLNMPPATVYAFRRRAEMI
jgi:phosphatidylethanolamine/phosphatidyl-N-methylethanolamine N-methyltransferase